MSLAIRRLPKKAIGQCTVCKARTELYSWDSNLGGRICRDCEPYLIRAEKALVALKCGHPDELLVYRNP